MHHADSFLEPIIPDMVELGIDIWQGALPQNDIVKIQSQLKDLGSNMILMGGIDAAVVDKKDCPEDVIRTEAVSYTHLLLVLSAILLLTAVVMPVTAANKKNAGRHISMCSNGTCSLRIKGNHAAADCHVINKGADKMTVTMDLLKYKNGTWKKVQSCGKTTRKLSLIHISLL